MCGNSTCELGESNTNCPSDCPSIKETCGNGKIEPGEICSTCPRDTQPCEPVDPRCDGNCGPNDCENCLSDCDTTNVCLAYCVQNGKKDALEMCDPTDNVTQQGRGNAGCSATCQPINDEGAGDTDCDGVCGVNDCDECLSDCDQTNVCLAYCIPNGIRDAGEECDPSEVGCNELCQRITSPDPYCNGKC
ncbi:MAG: hypothetical protein LBG52_00940 [Candidatus Peribacteria bacterium]|nr:hypothetical protein [Candidatus Peribacteria bacterium]